MKIVISSGHGKYIRGASASPRPPYLDEVDEARRVVDRIAELWRGAGVGVDVYHDNTSTSQSQNLGAIVGYHNSRSRDYDVSCHFNAYQKTTKAMGVEVLYVTQQKLAADTSLAIAQAGSFINRGAKKRTDLSFLNNTNKPAILLEVCFVDSEADSNLYRKNFEAICKRIAEVVGKVSIGGTPGQPPSPETPPTEPPPVVTPPPDEETARVDIAITTTGPVIVSINGEDFMVSAPGPETPATAVFPPNQSGIICTVFGGNADPNNSAYPPYDKITDAEISCALPYRFKDPRPKVLVHNTANDKDAICEIRDIGPWNIDDPYWQTGARPQAETGTDKKGRKTNGAGIDLTPGAAKAIGLSGKGTVDWRFIEDDEVVA
jgi:N-acetylmuramoyl-L-alanine amidase